MGFGQPTFGAEYASPQGYIAVATTSEREIRHRVGGSSWKIADDDSVSDTPILLLVLDLRDAKLSALRHQALQELPLCSYLNSDLWEAKQTFRIDAAKKEIRVEERLKEISYTQLAEDALPNPLPETMISLRPMTADEVPVDEESYWRACDSFLGGDGVLRVLGQPLWMQFPETQECACGREMTIALAMGYESDSPPHMFIGDQPLFIGEGALYFFACVNCLMFSVVSQST